MLTIKYERESYVDYGRVTSIVMDKANFVGTDNDTWEAVSEAQSVAYAQVNLLACRFNHQQDELAYMTKSCKNQMSLARERMDMVWEWQKQAHILQMALDVRTLFCGKELCASIYVVEDGKERFQLSLPIDVVSKDNSIKENKLSAAKWLYENGYRPSFGGVSLDFPENDTEDIPF